MPAFPHLTGPEVDALVAYLTELGGGEAAPAVAVATPTGAALGERIYRSNCASCHEAGRVQGRGMMMMCRPASLAGATQRFTNRQVMNLLDVGVGPMPAFRHLTTTDRDALWAYLETLPAEPGAQPMMGQTCPMVRAAMEGRRIDGMNGRGMMGGRMMMGDDMMGDGMSCPMMRDGSARIAGDTSQLPVCCR